MASKDESTEIVAPPSTAIAPEDEGKKEEHQPDEEAAEGLLSTTPSSVPIQGPLVGQLEQLMTIIQTCKRENNDLRNQLADQNLIIEHKTRNLQQINENYRVYDEKVKQKYQETAEKFKALRAENVKLRDDIKRFGSPEDRKPEGTGDAPNGDEDEGNSLSSWISLEMENKGGEAAESTAESRKLKSQLKSEQERSAELSQMLEKTNKRREFFEKKLDTALSDLAQVKAERKKDNQELRKTLGGELNTYKNKVQALTADLNESNRNLALHARKVQELHDANLQFDEVNTAYHSKLSMYEDELKKRDDYIEDLKAQHKQVMQRITREIQEKQTLEESYGRVQEALRAANKQVYENRHEKDGLTARVVSMGESLEARDRKLKTTEDSVQFLQVQLKQYQQDFQGERLAREQLHQRLQEKEAECERVQKRADELQMMVDNYTHVHMQRLSNQYSHPAPSPSPVTPPSPNLYNQNPMSTLYSTGQSRNFTEQHSYMGDTQPMTTEDNQQVYKCPVCNEIFAESGSLEIHVNSHFEN